ncbi:hypothetical protein BH09PSE1_BH09PSE1_28680 [soil metagenome]
MPPRLSARQEQCVRLTAFRTDKEIAAHLGISEATVKKHVHEACQRLGVNRRKAALAILDQKGPGYPNDPMAEPVQVRSDRPSEGEPVDGQGRGTTAGPELGESGDSGSGGLDAVPGYRAPPRGPLFRLTMIAVIAVVICALLIAVAGMVGEIHHVAGRLDPH